MHASLYYEYGMMLCINSVVLLLLTQRSQVREEDLNLNLEQAASAPTRAQGGGGGGDKKAIVQTNLKRS
jgi:hypothetical protein